jgi:hypothetical protein
MEIHPYQLRKKRADVGLMTAVNVVNVGPLALAEGFNPGGQGGVRARDRQHHPLPRLDLIGSRHAELVSPDAQTNQLLDRGIPLRGVVEIGHDPGDRPPGLDVARANLRRFHRVPRLLVQRGK